MKKNPLILVILAFLLCLTLPVLGQNPQPGLTLEDVFEQQHRVSAPKFSPDGKQIVFVNTRYDFDADNSLSSVWLMNADGSACRQFLQRGVNPIWSKDGKSLYFFSARDERGMQLWSIGTGGGEAVRQTQIPGGLRSAVFLPGEQGFLYSAPLDRRAKTLRQAQELKRKDAAGKVQAKIYDHLYYRAGLGYRGEERSNIFRCTPGTGEPENILPGGNADVTGWALSPDGKEICYAMNPSGSTDHGLNYELYLTPSAGGKSVKITDNPSFDLSPAYSPDGKYIAYLSSRNMNIHGDYPLLALYSRKEKTHTIPTGQPDRYLTGVFWSPDSRFIYLNCNDKTRTSLFKYSLADGSCRKISDRGGLDGDFSLSPDGRKIVFTRNLANKSGEIYVMDSDGGGVKQLTRMNRGFTAAQNLPEPEYFTFRGEKNDVEGLLVRPIPFDPTKKYPVLLMIVGGPHMQWQDNFGAYFNPYLFAARGYAVVKINPTGSGSYGRKFSADVLRDFGGSPFKDLMLGMDYVIEKHPFLDNKRLAAYGGSYGGYMVNWINGQTDRFACLISACGIYNLPSFYGSSDVKWHWESEMGGPPWNSEDYEKWSPHNHAGQMRTPTLILHGELDSRVSVEEGMQLFTALQRQNVPSRLMLFPDEGHGIGKPQNLKAEMDAVADWLDMWCKP